MSSMRELPPTTDIACRIYEVLQGDKVGWILGFRTADMFGTGDEKPDYGIYAARVFLPDGRVLDAAANLGIRPTFSPPKELLETSGLPSFLTPMPSKDAWETERHSANPTN